MSGEGCDCPVCGEGYPEGRPECEDIKAHVDMVERLREEKYEAEGLALSLGRTVDLLADTAEAWAALHPEES